MRQEKLIRTAGILLLVGLAMLLAYQAPPIQARTGITVPIQVQGHVTLQRPNAPPPDPSWVVPLVITLSTPGTNDALYTWNVTTDESGTFTTLETFATGTYDVRVKNPHTLRNLKRNVTFIAGVNTIDLGLLHEGDANDDNRVNVADFAILRGAYFTEEGQPGFDPRADFDEDNRVNVRDFALLRSNYFEEGDVVVPRIVPLALLNPVGLEIRPPVARGPVARPITLTVYLDAGNTGVVGTDVVLAYDPTRLQVVDASGAVTDTVVPGDAFDTVLTNRVDHTGGRIIFGAGTFGDPTTGRHVLFAFHVLANSPVFTTTVEFAYVDVVDADGRSLDTRARSARVQAGEFPHAFVPALPYRHGVRPRAHLPLLLRQRR